MRVPDTMSRPARSRTNGTGSGAIASAVNEEHLLASPSQRTGAPAVTADASSKLRRKRPLNHESATSVMSCRGSDPFEPIDQGHHCRSLAPEVLNQLADARRDPGLTRTDTDNFDLVDELREHLEFVDQADCSGHRVGDCRSQLIL